MAEETKTLKNLIEKASNALNLAWQKIGSKSSNAWAPGFYGISYQGTKSEPKSLLAHGLKELTNFTDVERKIILDSLHNTIVVDRVKHPWAMDDLLIPWSISSPLAIEILASYASKPERNLWFL